jgi:hypothetical protein
MSNSHDVLKSWFVEIENKRLIFRGNSLLGFDGDFFHNFLFLGLFLLLDFNRFLLLGTFLLINNLLHHLLWSDRCLGGDIKVEIFFLRCVSVFKTFFKLLERFGTLGSV